MAGITLQMAEAQLEAYLAAERTVLTNQAYEIAGRRLTRANLAEIQVGINTWNSRVVALGNAVVGRRRNRVIVPGG